MPISRINKHDLLGGALMDFLAKAGSGLSTGYGQAKDTEKFNDAFGTIQHRQTQIGQEPYSVENLGPLAQLLQTQHGAGAVGLMKDFRNPIPTSDPFTLGQGQKRYNANGVEIADNPKPFEPPSMGQPTTYAKAVAERDKIRSANPNDARLPGFNAYIKKLEEGPPNFRLFQDAQGQYNIFDPKHAAMSGGTGVYAPTSAEVRQQYASLDDVQKNSGKLRLLLKKGATGPVTGRLKKYGVLFFNDKEAQELINTAGQLRTIIYGLSGKQINEAELEWLNTEILPRITQPDENFETTLDTFESWVKQRQGSIETQFPGLIGGGGEEDSDDDPLGLFK